MRLISNGLTLSKNIIKLLNKHDKMAFAVAWASSETDAFEQIRENRQKIVRAAIGTHFYQTHPTVLESFVGSNKVKFVLQPQGVFHPKVYLFWSKGGWDVLIGSANLTDGAMNSNSELMLHISSKDNEDSILNSEIQCQIDEYWNMGEVITDGSAEKYRALWKAQQPALKRISGLYSGEGRSKAPIHTEIMSMSWESFYNLVQADPHHGFDLRCDLLELVRNAFRENDSFAHLDIGLRKTIAGLPNDQNEHWGWFGSMQGAGYYHQAVNDNNFHLSAALDLIPLDGAISCEHYDSYIEEFIQAFPNGRHGIGIASRLLALKRPDYFVCLDSKNKSRLCKDFGIKQTGITYERYWEDVICRITDSVWWNSPRPRDRTALRVWLGRAAMLDAIFYQP
ncbi:MAG: phospholipase D-like domain-containing protein [Methylomicrobium sp.]